MRISNVNTLSALLDRLVTENIKLYFFNKDGNAELVQHQILVTSEIKREIEELFSESLKSGGYKYIQEKRTFVRELLVNLDELVSNDVHIGESDRMRLIQLKSDNPSIDVLLVNEARLRTANEGRSLNKNNIDNEFKNIVTKK